jgi:hypothetical protein
MFSKKSKNKDAMFQSNINKLKDKRKKTKSLYRIERKSGRMNKTKMCFVLIMSEL